MCVQTRAVVCAVVLCNDDSVVAKIQALIVLTRSAPPTLLRGPNPDSSLVLVASSGIDAAWLALAASLLSSVHLPRGCQIHRPEAVL